MSWPHTPDIAPGRLCRERDLDHAMQSKDCAACAGQCAAPQACQQPENLTTWPLEPLFARHAWLGPLLLSIVCFVWLCADGLLSNP